MYLAAWPASTARWITAAGLCGPPPLSSQFTGAASSTHLADVPCVSSPARHKTYKILAWVHRQESTIYTTLSQVYQLDMSFSCHFGLSWWNYCVNLGELIEIRLGRTQTRPSRRLCSPRLLKRPATAAPEGCSFPARRWESLPSRNQHRLRPGRRCSTPNDDPPGRAAGRRIPRPDRAAGAPC